MKCLSRFCACLAIFSFLPLSPALAQQPIPEAAQQHFQAGVALIQKADVPDDLRNALTEFEAAAGLAPQWPEIHYNLAQLAAETDKPAKAINEFGIYLNLAPEAADRAKVQEEIVRLQCLIAIKRKIGLPGVTFAAMPDGIWVMQVYPGSRVGNTGLRKGAKIIAVEGTSVAGATLEDFFRAIDATTAESDPLKAATKGRMFTRSGGYARYNKTASSDNKVEETGPIVTLKIKSPGLDRSGTLFFKKSMFHSNVIEIEADEFDTEVTNEKLPVLVTFWADWCEPCHEFVPIVETQSAEHAGKIKFININADENKKLAGQLGVKGLPTMMIFKNGQLMSTHTGRLPKEKIEQVISSAVGMGG
ncbi:MAG: thioredoxin [Desulfobacteraceae bacterium]|nr:MAG: thioredoxin [Desulfobacteraceae bacterium]